LALPDKASNDRNRRWIGWQRRKILLAITAAAPKRKVSPTWKSSPVWHEGARSGFGRATPGAESSVYLKNDQPWVEQKNGAIVRKLIGYGRLEGLTATAALRRRYEASAST
jgi:hypothetical protein